MASSIIDVTRNMVRDYMARLDPSHDMEHVERVVRMALKLGQQESLRDKVDLEVIELAALCHDIGDAKYTLEHEGVLKFLTRHDYDKAALVAQIVNHVGYRKELKWKKEDTLATWRDTCMELHTVMDADKLDAIGAFGILRCAAFSGAKGIVLHQPKDNNNHQHDEEQQSSAIDHFHEKLFSLSGMMRTPMAQAMAEQRTKYMHDFVSQIEREYSLDI
ncbi:hypothetical protein K492DRAFT_207166 [Lichtheimia hyalospora FSU 10163]|nr:hypothetical protein K492DRAFT_207166 [Lichtheimia hyalospora FSU 10163]